MCGRVVSGVVVESCQGGGISAVGSCQGLGGGIMGGSAVGSVRGEGEGG